jgi:curved DNA-binding protein CbpA
VRPAAPPPRPAAPAARPAAPAAAAANPSLPLFLQAPPDETPAQQLGRLQAALDYLGPANHFEALGLTRKANAAEVKKTFFVLARELHPDTVSDVTSPLHALKVRLFARINEASQVLGDEAQRKEYEAELDGKAGAVDVSRIFAAEEKFQRGEIMIRARKYVDGLKLIEEAIQLNDKEAEFFAWRGWAKFLLAKDRQLQHPESVADCKKALALVDRCLPAWLFLANMAKAMGNLKEAERNFKKVIDLDPKHVEALRELRLMGKK